MTKELTLTIKYRPDPNTLTAVALRIVGFLVLIAIGGSMLMYVVTRDRRWVRFGWQVFKYALIVVAIVLAFLALERLILAV